ncbi:MAG: hypothetical protein AAFX87_30255 [Bacteroidota bacterium]
MRRTISAFFQNSVFLTLLLIFSLSLTAFAQSVKQEKKEMAAIHQTVIKYHQGFSENNPEMVGAVLGKELIMFNGNFSSDPIKWQAHMYLTGNHLKEWPKAFLEMAAPYQNEFKVLSTHINGEAAVMVTEDTGRNKYRMWKKEQVTWLLGKSDDQWKIIGFYIKDIANPEKHER